MPCRFVESLFLSFFIGHVQSAAHPSKHEFATVGDDKQLRIVDMNTHSTVKLSCFDAEARFELIIKAFQFTYFEIGQSRTVHWEI